MSLPGAAGGIPPGGVPRLTGAGALDPTDPNVKMAQDMAKMQGLMESCYAKTVMSGVMGFGLGGLFGAFMASMSYDTPMHTATVPGDTKTAISDLPWRQQLKHGFKDMGQRSYSSAKNFGKVGALFSGIECGIEGYRAKNDLTNGVAAGCATGALLARGGGPQAAAVGCAGFAAFSAAIDVWMRMPKEEE